MTDGLQASLVDRFICRREGHKPNVTLPRVPGVTGYRTTCRRCGQRIDVAKDGQ